MESVSASPKLTPMMEQYRAIKKTLPPDAILFFRLGDFYEMFFEDALRASEILDITLTGREGGEAGRVPMCGIPYHSFQGYVRTLVDHNLKVAICEQIGDPKLAKGIVERKISRIISPATYLEDENKSPGAEYMAAIAKEGNACALAYLDLGTGEFYVQELDEEKLLGQLSILSPREAILPKSLSESGPLASFIKGNLKAALTSYEDWVFEAEEGLRLLKENFRLASEKSILFSGRPLCVAASGAILYYLRDHLHSALGHVRIPVVQDQREFMVLDREAQKSLELVVSMSGRRDSATLLACLDQTLTSMGNRTLYHWVTHPLLELEPIQERQNGIEELIENPALLHDFRGLLKGVKDVERTLSRLNCGVANARDLLNLKLFLGRVPAIKNKLEKCRAGILKNSSAAVQPFPALQELIQKSICDAPPLGLRDGGMIRDGYAAKLDELRNISRNGKSWIAEFERREIERTGIKSLKVKYSHVFGYALEISKSNLHLVPSDYIRRQTLANAERFIVTELKTWDEKISGAEDKIKALEYEIFNQVRGRVLQDLVPLQEMARAIGNLDALCSLAMISLQKNWIRPEVNASEEIVIRGGRHPVVEAMLPAGQFVENDALLDRTENQLIVLTGPNMAGKSTYIRQIAHIVLLAQMGSFVPADSAKIGIVDRIFTRIGASDDLARGESTFMVEMLETAHILQSSTSKSLLILDEVGRGTSTFDGVSIAWAICEFLVKEKNPRTLFATHYHELTQLEAHFPSIKNYNIAVRETKGKGGAETGIIFLRKVIRGGSDRSYGIHVARLAGIPEAVTRRAHQILNILESENNQATQIIEARENSRKKKMKSAQPELFAELGGLDSSLLEEIRNLALDNMTPLEALSKIAEWKERLRSH